MLTPPTSGRSEEHTSELQSRRDLVCRLLLEKKNDAGWRLPRPVPGTGAAAGLADRGRRRHLRCRIRDHRLHRPAQLLFFFFKDPAAPEIYALSLHDALPI